MSVKLSEAQNICLNIMSAFEGTGYTKLEGSFDDQGFTFGLIGFCLGQGSLQPLIKAFHDEDENLFYECCTVYVPAYKKEMNLGATLLGVSLMSTDKAVKWSLERQQNNKPDPQWIDVFKRLGNQEKFKEVQRRFAYAKFSRAISYCNKYNLKSVRALMLFFDCTVQQGSMKATTQSRVDKRFKNVSGAGIARDKQVMKICAEEMAEQAIDRWAKDVLSRRMCIVNGRGTVHGQLFNLDKDYGLSDESFV